MRRRISVVPLLAASVAFAALGTPWGPLPTAVADDIAPVRAVVADSLVESYGVGIHLGFWDTPYADAEVVAEALHELGVRHVRDDLFLNNPRQYAAIRTVAAKGIRFNLIMGRPTDSATPADYVRTVAGQLPRGVVESLEGVNEWDLSDRSDWVAEMKDWQGQLRAAAAADPATADLPVLAPALAFRWNYEVAGDLSRDADEANGHMYPGGYPPLNEVARITTAIRESIPGKPLVTTEAGYHNALNTRHGHLPVPEDVAGLYLPRLLLDHFMRGVKRVYTYELIDEFEDPALTNPEAHFGLLRRDLGPKPAYTAMRALLSLLSDPGPSFPPESLALEVDGLPADGRQLLTQKRNGQFVLLLWRDVSVYDPRERRRLVVSPSSVTLRLTETSRLDVYRPTAGTTPVLQAEARSLPLQLDGEVTAITIDSVPALAPTNEAPASAPAPADPAAVPARVPSRPAVVSTSVGRRGVTVAWRKPDPHGRRILGYRLSRGTRVVNVGPRARRATLRGLPGGKRLRVAVRARNAVGWSRPTFTRYVTIRR